MFSLAADIVSFTLIPSRLQSGFTIFLLCQLFGSVISLAFLPPHILAPLGSAGLVFNVIFSNIFLNTTITKYDIWGTFWIIVGAVLMTVFGNTGEEERK
jgi:uncharacterized membrane protein